eukprot:3680542-Pleurochrysis_carterae.AAC.2
MGINIDIGASGHVKISASAYIKAKAKYYLPITVVAEYPRYDSPASPQLVKDYETAARKGHTVDPVLQKKFLSSKVGALTHAPPPMQTTGQYLRYRHSGASATFPTKEMDEHADRVLA